MTRVAPLGITVFYSLQKHELQLRVNICGMGHALMVIEYRHYTNKWHAHFTLRSTRPDTTFDILKSNNWIIESEPCIPNLIEGMSNVLCMYIQD